MGADDEVRELADTELDEGLDEGWLRLTDEPDVRGVGAAKLTGGGDAAWSVSVWAMEFVRPPLETELQLSVETALAAVPAVIRVSKENRETWRIDGQPAGRALARAAAQVVDVFAPRIRNHLHDDL